MLLAGLLLVAAQATADAAASEVRAALISAKIRMESVSVCRPDGADALQARYEQLRADASGLIRILDPSIGDSLRPTLCRSANAAADVRLATTALDRLAAAVTRRLVAMHGLWLGPLRLCGGSVAEVTESRDEQDLPAILLYFSPAMSDRVRGETAQRVNTQLPVVLDGRVLIAPRVNEPITGGAISIAGPELPSDASSIRAAAARSCAR